MDQSSQERSALFAGEGSSTLALVIYLAITILLMIADRRGGYLEEVHAYAARLSGPLYTLAEMPWLVGRALRDGMVQRSQLNSENRQLHQAVLQRELRISDSECESVIRLVKSDLRGTIVSFMQAAPAEEPDQGSR